MPTGSYVITFRFAYLFDQPKSGAILLFKPVEGIPKHDWSHRVVSTRGQSVLIVEDKGRRDTDDKFKDLSAGQEVLIPSGYVYQRGDSDSSFHGFAETNLIKAGVLFHFLPPWHK